MTTRILIGHVLNRLADLPDESVHMCVTSPPYYGLRDYGIEPQIWGGAAACAHDFSTEIVEGEIRTGLGMAALGERYRGGGHKAGKVPKIRAEHGFCRRCSAWRGSLGLEPTIELYLDHMVDVFREVRRAMRRDGTLWVNIGDSYANDGKWGGHTGGKHVKALHDSPIGRNKRYTGFKPKDLMLIPSRLAIRLQENGWWVRSDIAWCKRSPMPESCTDRPTVAWEHVFLLTKSARYFYDAVALKEKSSDNTHAYGTKLDPPIEHAGIGHVGFRKGAPDVLPYRNMRNFWLLGPEPFPEAHFATFPTEIPRRAILAGSKVGDTILDPFFGAGTTGLVADQLQRDCIGIEINPKYAEMAERRIRSDNSLFADVAAE